MSIGDANIDRKARVKDAKAKKAARAAAERDRDGSAFIQVPHVVFESAGWRAASHTARSLLMHIAISGRNGEMTASMKYLRPLGWRSAGTVVRAVQELIQCGLLVQTRPGQLPSTPALYAVTWKALATGKAISVDPQDWGRGNYSRPAKAMPLPTSRTNAANEARRRKPRAGDSPVPSDGALEGPSVPSDGALESKKGAQRSVRRSAGGTFRRSSVPSDGAYLESNHLLERAAATAPELEQLITLFPGGVPKSHRDAATKLWDERKPDPETVTRLMAKAPHARKPDGGVPALPTWLRLMLPERRAA